MKSSFLLLTIFMVLNTHAQLTYGPENLISVVDGVVNVYSADLDGDGDLDLLSCATNSGISFWANDGAGNFTLGQYLQELGADNSSITAAIGDYDLDGDLDVFAAIDVQPGTSPVSFQYFINNGGGSFSNGLVIGEVTSNVQEVHAADFDLDNDLDIIYVESANDQIGWIENQGVNSWSGPVFLNGQSNGAQTVSVADFDQDGDQDILAAGQYDDEWAWHRNNGDQTISPEIIIGTGDNVSSLTQADINNDGFIDGVAVYGIDGDVVWAPGNGDGFDTPIVLYDGPGFPDNYPITVELTDLDLDGDLDLVVCSILADVVTWYANLGAGNFSPREVLITGAANVRQTAHGDFDGDGDIDIAAANFGADDLVWYENTSLVLVPGCTDDQSCNYNAAATSDDGSCDYSCLGCTDPLDCNFDPEASILDDSCSGEICGCTDDGACNFDPLATQNNGSCDYACLGCTNENACNYNPESTIDDGSCIVVLSPLGCMNEQACNYDINATEDDGLCYFSPIGYSCDGTCIDLDENGTCDVAEAPGCTDPTAINYMTAATQDDGSCISALSLCGTGTFWDITEQQCIANEPVDDVCLGDFNGDEIINAGDLLLFLGVFGSNCQ